MTNLADPFNPVWEHAARVAHATGRQYNVAYYAEFDIEAYLAFFGSYLCREEAPHAWDSLRLYYPSGWRHFTELLQQTYGEHHDTNP